MIQTKCHIRQGFLNRWYIFSATDGKLAWSGSRWVPASPVGLPMSAVQVSNLSSREAAENYAVSCGLEVENA